MSSAVRSIYSVTIGGDVLLAVDDLLWGEPENILRLTPDFSGVERVAMVGGGARTFDRGNRMHTLEFSRVRLHATVQEALRFQLMHPGDLPPGGQDVTIGVSGYTGVRTLYKASIVGATIFTLHQLSITSYIIIGGDITGNLTTGVNLLDQDGDIVTDQAADPMEAQS